MNLEEVLMRGLPLLEVEQLVFHFFDNRSFFNKIKTSIITFAEGRDVLLLGRQSVHTVGLSSNWSGFLLFNFKELKVFILRLLLRLRQLGELAEGRQWGCASWHLAMCSGRDWSQIKLKLITSA